jgi:hypothetical protein
MKCTGQRPPLPPVQPPIIIREAPPKVPPAVGTQGTMRKLIEEKKKKSLNL